MKNAKPLNEKPRLLFGFYPWLTVVIAVILGLAIIIMAVQNNRREKRNMIDGFVARGEALIWALEAGSRAWMGFEGDSRLLQMLIEETAGQPGLIYLAVVDDEGNILAHNEAGLIGKGLGEWGRPLEAGKTAEKWRLIEVAGDKVFEVFRRFEPVAGGHHPFIRGRDDHHGRGAGRGEGRGYGRAARAGAWEARSPEPGGAGESSRAYVLVGLDRRALDDALEANFYGSLLTALVVAFMALGGLVSAFWAYHYRLSRRQLELEVSRNERLAALGHMAAGVAHEIRNPLSSIKGLATYLAQKFPHDDDGVEAARTMIGEVDRLNRVVSQLLEFARPSVLELKPADPAEVVRRALRLAESDIKSRQIEVRFNPPEERHLVGMDEERLTQALLNLILNAVQAMEPHGILTISLEAREGEMHIAVADSGPGLSAELLKSIFTPYFTTKPSGSGLGLSIVQQIVEGHQGRISVKSRPSQGSVFTLTLPRPNRGNAPPQRR